MSFRANTTVSVMRGTVTDGYGDEADSDEVVASRIPAFIGREPARGGRPASGRADTPRTYQLQTWWRGLQQNDRIRDERTGQVYYVTSLDEPVPLAALTSTHAEMQRVT